MSIGLYMAFMVVLFTVIYFVSVMATDYLFKEEEKTNKLKELKNQRLRKANKKKYFIDVA
jgi:Na+-transporting methylmalonyl-CoA/oxaloacetate decarboxylase gamma subunit